MKYSSICRLSSSSYASIWPVQTAINLLCALGCVCASACVCVCSTWSTSKLHHLICHIIRGTRSKWFPGFFFFPSDQRKPHWYPIKFRIISHQLFYLARWSTAYIIFWDCLCVVVNLHLLLQYSNNFWVQLGCFLWNTAMREAVCHKYSRSHCVLHKKHPLLHTKP